MLIHNIHDCASYPYESPGMVRAIASATMEAVIGKTNELIDTSCL